MNRIKTLFCLFIISMIFLAACGRKAAEPNEETSVASISVTPTPGVVVTPLPTPVAASITPMPSGSDAAAVTQTDDTDENNMNITLYLYGPDDYENPSEKKAIQVSRELYETNMTEALNQVFSETEIRINSTAYNKETKCLTVDISKDVAAKFNAGSSMGTELTNELTDTILNLPDIQSTIITVDGKKDCYEDHYSFEGVFTKDKK